MARVALEDVELQLAEARETAFTNEDWLFELKLDGFRMLAERVDGVVRLMYRRGLIVSKTWPEIVSALEAIPGGDFVLDGELVIQDSAGHPVFQRLLKRSMLTSTSDVTHASANDPAVFFAFDLISSGTSDLRKLPLHERKTALQQVLHGAEGRVRVLDSVDTQGEALLEAVRAQSLEGIVAKRKDSRYESGRRATWLKIALKVTGDFVVIGFAAEWGALHLATWNGVEFVYANKVGIPPAIARKLKPLIESQQRKNPPCAGQVPKEKDARWVEPQLVIEVRYKNWPEGLAPREPIFVRLRDDKRPEDCDAPVWLRVAKPVTSSKLKNAQKLYFPGEGITKLEVVEYYRQIAPLMLVYLRDRPLLMERYPDGITGKSFFQRHLPNGAPATLRTIRVHSESENRELDQIVCDSAEALEWCVTQAAITFHIPSTRISTPDKADWSVVDFDPKGAPFEHVVRLTLGLKDVCDEVGLQAVVKTSGSSGIHVFVATHQQFDDAGAQSLAQLLALVLTQRFPDISTTERVISERKGRVYLDALQNYGGKTIAAPYSVRARPGAPVSMPIPWALVPSLKSPRDFTVRNAPEFVAKHGDPVASLFTGTPANVPLVLEKLQAAISAGSTQRK